MRSLRRSGRGISEIVGALMLVLIVVVAATSLAVFVAQYQKQLQAQQALTHNRQLENLGILHVTPFVPAGASAWVSLNITVSSLDVNPSVVDEITINDQPVKQYTVWELNLGTGNFSSQVVPGGGTLNLSGTEQVNVNVSFNQSSPSFSFYSPTFAIPLTSYLKIDLLTGLQNDFTRAFIPPTAVAVIDPLVTFNGTAYNTVPVLDGSSSFQAGNSSIIGWSWFVVPIGGAGAFPLFGEKVVLNASVPPPLVTYNITLTVTDTDGLVGQAVTSYTT